MASPDALRLSIDDFTRMGLLTAEEIASKTPVSRIVSLQNEGDANAASLTQYESATSPKGVRTEFNLVADDRRDPDAITPEITFEASISKSSTVETRGWFLPRAVEVEPRTYFSLATTLRYRNEQYKTDTVKAFTIGAVQDPEDPNSFIVDYVLQSQPDLMRAFRTGGPSGALQEMRNDPMLPQQKVLEIVRHAMTQNAPVFEQLRGNPDVTRKIVMLGQSPA